MPFDYLRYIWKIFAAVPAVWPAVWSLVCTAFYTAFYIAVWNTFQILEVEHMFGPDPQPPPGFFQNRTFNIGRVKSARGRDFRKFSLYISAAFTFNIAFSKFPL